MNLKKPKFWDYKKPSIYAYILFPISFLINFSNSIIKKLSKTNSNKSNIKTICIGNFYIGGTGKTSLSITLNDLLRKKKIKSCFIKKNYNNQIDEQKLLSKNGKLFSSSQRLEALNKADSENYQVAIFDDGLQDKSIAYDLKIVCFNTLNWIGNGMTIPSGPLRESINNLKNYNHVFLNGNLENIEDIKEQILQINPVMNIYLGKYEPINLSEFNKSDKYIIFSGIGNHKTFVSMIKNYGLNIFYDFEFPDHYNYSKKDIDNILDTARKSNCKIITTEKDYLRIDNINNSEIKCLKSELKILEEDKILSAII
tara:strand:+ start:190 stop:1125 length:936 start_codon:yes stop_codon:yes gene_type:complete